MEAYFFNDLKSHPSQGAEPLLISSISRYRCPILPVLPISIDLTGRPCISPSPDDQRHAAGPDDLALRAALLARPDVRRYWQGLVPVRYVRVYALDLLEDIPEATAVLDGLLELH